MISSDYLLFPCLDCGFLSPELSVSGICSDCLELDINTALSLVHDVFNCENSERSESFLQLNSSDKRSASGSSDFRESIHFNSGLYSNSWKIGV